MEGIQVTASCRDRIVAAAIDLLILCLLDAVCFLSLFLFFHLPLFFLPGVCFLVHLLYCTAFMYSRLCATPGMFFRKLCVNKQNAEAIGIGRLLLRAVYSFFSCLPLGIGLWYCLIDNARCTIYDYASGVYVFSLTQKNTSGEIPYLIVHENGEHKKYRVTENGIMVGRNPSSCQVLYAPDVPAVSRQHCIVKLNPQTGAFLIKDCSRFGTFLQNGTPVPTESFAVVNAGESFYIGTREHRLTLTYLSE